MKRNLVLLVVALALTGCQTVVLTNDGICEYAKEDTYRGLLFLRQCHEGFGTTFRGQAKELGHGMMVVDWPNAEPGESYWFAYGQKDNIVVAVNSSFSPEEVVQLNEMGWHTELVEQIEVQGNIWAGKMFTKYTVISLPAKASRAELIKKLRELAALGWLYNVTV